MIALRQVIILQTIILAALMNPLQAKPCAQSFGTILGQNANTIGYSNCNNDHESGLWQYVILNNQKKIKSGMKWQCVEYARRWLIHEKHITFKSIDHAYQIWDLKYARALSPKKQIKWVKSKNGEATTIPKPGDLLIYDKTQGPHGHVSVIVFVKNKKVYIAEQNYDNQLWAGKDYARVLPLLKDKEGHYRIDDKGVIGWMSL